MSTGNAIDRDPLAVFWVVFVSGLGWSCLQLAIARRLSAK